MPTQLQERKFEKSFALMDIDRNDYIDAADIEAVARRVAEQAGKSLESPELREVKETLTNFWRALDTDHNGRLHREEFIEAATKLAQRPEELDRILTPGNRALAKLFDTDGDGKITREEFDRMNAKSGLTAAERELAFCSLDQDKDGHVTVEELTKAAVDFYRSNDERDGANRVAGFF